MSLLSQNQAERIVKATLEAARLRNAPPMSVAVVDAGGHLQFAVREDGGGLAGIDIAAGKARAGMLFKCSSRQIADGLSGNPQAFQSVLSLLGGRIVLLPGAVLLKTPDGEILGAVGAAGGAPLEDEAIAEVGANVVL